MGPIYLLLCLVAFTSCDHLNPGNQVQKESQFHALQDTGSDIQECIPRDTTTRSGIKIHYLCQNGAYKISWGNLAFQRTYDSLFTCTKDTYGSIWDFIPKLEAETPNNLVFKTVLSTSSGANPAPIDFTAIILPKNAIDTVVEAPFYIQCIGNYMLYQPTWESLYLMNIETKKQQEIVLSPPAVVERSIAFALKKISIKNGKLLIDYEALGADDEIYIERRAFKIRV